MSEELVTVRVDQDGVEVGNVTREKDDLVDIPESEAEILEKSGVVEILDDAESAAEAEEKDENTKLKDWARTSNWLSADDVEKGDIITILSKAEMEEYQGDEYPVIEVEHDKTQANLRLNKGNTQNIAEEFGWNDEEWIGEQIKVVSIKEYPGVNSKGMILEPVRN